MPIDDILLECEDQMEKAVAHLHHELRGVRTGRASPALIEFLKVDYYGAPTDLKSIAAINVNEGNQLIVKPFSPADIGPINKAIADSPLGLNPQSDGKQIRIALPSMSMDRRKQLVGQVKQYGEESKVKIRNARRDANKDVDAEEKAGEMGEDDASRAKDDVQDLTKQYEEKVVEACKKKEDDVMEV
ncbi:MAG: ribosome recycling factor [Planctomycetota bacterium]